MSQQDPVSRPVGKKTCTLIPGDGVGPELTHAVKEVFKAACVPVEFQEYFLRYKWTESRGKVVSIGAVVLIVHISFLNISATR